MLNDNRKSIDFNTEVIKILELSDKDFKAAILKILYQATASMFEAMKNRKSLKKNEK